MMRVLGSKAEISTTRTTPLSSTVEKRGTVVTELVIVTIPDFVLKAEFETSLFTTKKSYVF